MSREPHMLDRDGKRLTILDCERGNHSGHFAIYRARAGEPFACADCLRKAGLNPSWLGTGR